MGKLIKTVMQSPVGYSDEKVFKPKRSVVKSTAEKIAYLNRVGYSSIPGEQSAREMIDTNKYVVIDNTSHMRLSGRGIPH